MVNCADAVDQLLILYSKGDHLTFYYGVKLHFECRVSFTLNVRCWMKNLGNVRGQNNLFDGPFY